ncbi:MAG: tRNA-intron lyase [Acidilobaceae archaeon]
MTCHIAYLIDDSIIVPDFESSRRLYSKSFYGTPIGVKKPKRADFNAPLKLSLIEALYLVEKGELKVVDMQGKALDIDELRRIALKSENEYIIYQIYKDLREKELIVRSGLKYGGAFTVYRIGPGLEHAPYIVHIYRRDENLDPIEIIRAGRVGHSVRKTFTLAFLARDGKPIYIMFKWVKL